MVEQDVYHDLALIIQPDLPSGYHVTDRQLPQGKNHQSIVVSNHKGREFVWKTRHPVNQNTAKLHFELSRVGFLQYGGRFRRRGLKEEASFSHQLQMFNYPVAAATLATDHGILYPLIEGIDVRQAVQAGVDVPLANLIDHLMTAHTKGMMYGDRWPQNMILDQQEQITQIDFDLEIGGPNAAELEITQLVFGLIRDSHNRWQTMTQIKQILTSQQGGVYNWTRVREFMLNYSRGYRHQDQEQETELRLAIDALLT